LSGFPSSAKSSLADIEYVGDVLYLFTHGMTNFLGERERILAPSLNFLQEILLVVHEIGIYIYIYMKDNKDE